MFPTPLEIAILNLAELAAVEDAPPFARLLKEPGAKPAGGADGRFRFPDDRQASREEDPAR